MDIYLVGGAVRDSLLGLNESDRPQSDRDWVVVGATVQEMLDQGYLQVGKDFPVFLHPRSKEEYALARTERKTAPGYTGFAFNADASVTLEQDLRRRDLTINAIAQDEDGNLVDPYGGRNDIEKRILRHVSNAFIEDPLRVLRVARFAARFAHLGFRVAEETMALLKTISASGELDHLVAERVWQEIEKALQEKTPTVFFEILRECGALAVILPEVDILFGVPQPEQYHPEIDTGTHVMLCLEQATLLSADPVVRFATLVHDVGKGVTPKDNWPHHYQHAQLGVAEIRRLCTRLRVPKKYSAIAQLVCAYHTQCHRVEELRASTTLKLLESLDAFRRPKQMVQFLLACEADSKGRPGYENINYKQSDILREALVAALSVDVKSLLAENISKNSENKNPDNDGIKALIARQRTRAIADALGKS